MDAPVIKKCQPRYIVARGSREQIARAVLQPEGALLSDLQPWFVWLVLYIDLCFLRKTQTIRIAFLQDPLTLSEASWGLLMRAAHVWPRTAAWNTLCCSAFVGCLQTEAAWLLLCAFGRGSLYVKIRGNRPSHICQGDRGHGEREIHLCFLWGGMESRVSFPRLPVMCLMWSLANRVA